VEIRHIRVGEALSQAVKTVFKNIFLLLGALFIFIASVGLAGSYLLAFLFFYPSSILTPKSMLLILASIFLMFLTALICGTGFFKMMLEIGKKGTSSVLHLFERDWRLIGRSFGVGLGLALFSVILYFTLTRVALILLELLMVLNPLYCILFSVLLVVFVLFFMYYLIYRFTFTIFLLIDKRIGVIKSFKQSWILTRGQRTLSIVKLMIICVILMGTPSLLPIGFLKLTISYIFHCIYLMTLVYLYRQLTAKKSKAN